MKSNMKRFLGLLLATLMVVTMVPTVAFADLTTEGNPNAFSVVADATGNQQTEFILADTLTVGDNTYYGIMTRKNIQSWHGDIKVGGTTLNFIADTTKASTDTAKYKKIITHVQNSGHAPIREDFDNLLTMLYPAAVQPYAQEIEMLYTDNPTKTSEKYYVTGKLFPPLADTIDANKDYIRVVSATPGSSGSIFGGLITRSKSGWRDDWTYFAGKCVNTKTEAYATSYAHLGTTNYQYYVTPVIYVTKDFFKNIKIDTTKEVGDKVKTFMAKNFNTLDVANAGYTAEEIEALGIPALPSPEGDTFVVNGVTYYMVPGATAEYKGETYVGVMTSQKVINWNADVDATYLEFTGTKDDGSVVGKLYRGVTDTKVDIQTYKNTFFSSFDGYIVDGDYEWSMGEARINSTDTVNTKLYGKGSISIPNTTEWSKLHTNSGAFYDGTGYLTRDISYMGTGHERKWKIWKKAAAGNNTASRVPDDEGKVIALQVTNNYGYWSFMTMIKEDFFLENKLDLATTSSNVRAFLANYKQTDFTADYNKNEFAVLGITEFDEEIKTEPGTGTKFTVGGVNYYLVPNSAMEYKGKNYVGVFNNTKTILGWNQDSSGAYLDFTGTREDGSVVGKLYIGYTDQKKDIQDYITNFAAFDGYLVDNDYQWGMGRVYMYPKENNALTNLYAVGTVGLPSTTEFSNLHAATGAFNDGTGWVTRSLGHSGSTSWPHQWNIWKTKYQADYPVAANSNAVRVEEEDGTLVAFKQGNYGYWSFMTYVEEDFFKENDIDMTLAEDGFKKYLSTNYTRDELTGWSKANLDILFGDYNGAGIGLVATKSANGAEVVIHNNGAEAAGAGATLIVASYDADGMVDVKTYVLKNNVSAGSKTSAFSFNLDMTGATSVKAMLWEDVVTAKPLASASYAE